MPLEEVILPIERGALPLEVRRFLREAQTRIEQFQVTGRAPAFVPSDYDSAYFVLRALAESELAGGGLFCEWGSGFGVVACLASMVGFASHGVEIEIELVDLARQLADDYGLSVEFACGSFVPKGGAKVLGELGNFSWLVTDEDNVGEELGVEVEDFDVIFAYPWPDEENACVRLFEHFAGREAILITHHSGDDFRLQRKAGASKGKKRRV